MDKVAAPRLFFKVYIDFLQHGFTWHECGVLFYNEKLNLKGMHCFYSVESMAKELHIPYSTLRRVVDGLIHKGVLLKKSKGRRRILGINEAFSPCSVTAQNEQHRNAVTAQNGQDEGAQNEQLPRSNIPRSKDLDLNIIPLGLNTNLDLSKETDGSVMIGETEKEKEIRLHLEAARRDSHGWEDHGDFLTKWDEKTRTTLRKRKGYQEKTWNGKKDRSDLPD